jgi:glucose-6-phosphate 1-dehydrogenase
MALEAPEPQAIVLFGASGDLARRKVLPSLYALAADGSLPERSRIVGVARSIPHDDAFRAFAREAVESATGGAVDEAVWGRFADGLSCITGDADDGETFARLHERLAAADDEDRTAGCRLHYLATPPELFATIAEGLGVVGENGPGTRILIEKPFGRSLETARELTERLHAVFDESQIFRIDHYLGKETVQNIAVLRFANSIFERLWNRDVIDHVQLTAAEDVGVEGRADYYESAGAIRDLLQNHMLQVLALLTMEPPRSLEPEPFRDEKIKLLRAVRPIDPADVVRGQYLGYRKEPGVDPNSRTETFVAAKVLIDNWRWEGVPFFLRHGKRLPRRCTEISVAFRRAPDYLFRDLGLDRMPSDHLTIRIQPGEGVSLAFQAKTPGPGYALQTVRMDFDYERSFMHASEEAYVRLLHDAMRGDHTLFTRADGVERAWEVVAPILDDPAPPHTYEPATWGPREADMLIAPRRWHLEGPA